jgi:hypothetical protein
VESSWRSEIRHRLIIRVVRIGITGRQESRNEIWDIPVVVIGVVVVVEVRVEYGASIVGLFALLEDANVGGSRVI